MSMDDTKTLTVSLEIDKPEKVNLKVVLQRLTDYATDQADEIERHTGSKVEVFSDVID